MRRSLTAIQLFAVTALLVSTTIYWAVVVLQLLNSLVGDPTAADAVSPKDAISRTQCVGTAMLTVNVRTPPRQCHNYLCVYGHWLGLSAVIMIRV